jgi:hypothetical protein
LIDDPRHHGFSLARQSDSRYPVLAVRPTDMEPGQQELETLLDVEEQEALEEMEVPDEVKVEIDERLERFREEDLEAERAEDAGNAPC